MSEKKCEWCENLFKYHVESRSDCYDKHPKNTRSIDKAFSVLKLLNSRRGVLHLHTCDEDIQEEILLELANELDRHDKQESMILTQDLHEIILPRLIAALELVEAKAKEEPWIDYRQGRHPGEVWKLGVDNGEISFAREIIAVVNGETKGQ